VLPCITKARKVYRGSSRFHVQSYFEMSSTLNRIPIVDFGALNLDHEQTPGENEPNVKELAKQMFDAFSTVGFVYITNHGMTVKTVRLCFFLLSNICLNVLNECTREKVCLIR